MVLSETGHHIRALLRVTRDMHPGLPVVLALLNHVIGDLGPSIVNGRFPDQADSVSKHLGELDWSNRHTRRSCQGDFFSISKKLFYVYKIIGGGRVGGLYKGPSSLPSTAILMSLVTVPKPLLAVKL